MGIRNQLYKRTVKSADRRTIEWTISFPQWVGLVEDECWRASWQDRASAWAERYVAPKPWLKYVLGCVGIPYE